jgi:hypothetical protein
VRCAFAAAQAPELFGSRCSVEATIESTQVEFLFDPHRRGAKAGKVDEFARRDVEELQVWPHRCHPQALDGKNRRWTASHSGDARVEYDVDVPSPERVQVDEEVVDPSNAPSVSAKHQPAADVGFAGRDLVIWEPRKSAKGVSGMNGHGGTSTVGGIAVH